MPPYGKIKSIQAKLQHRVQDYYVDVLSADFDQTITKKDAQNVVL
jgi:hypothetical protein